MNKVIYFLSLVFLICSCDPGFYVDVDVYNNNDFPVIVKIKPNDTTACYSETECYDSVDDITIEIEPFDRKTIIHDGGIGFATGYIPSSLLSELIISEKETGNVLVEETKRNIDELFELEKEEGYDGWFYEDEIYKRIFVLKLDKNLTIQP